MGFGNGKLMLIWDSDYNIGWGGGGEVFWKGFIKGFFFFLFFVGI